MSLTVRLELEFVDVRGERIADKVDIRVRHHVLQEQKNVDGHDARRPVAITGLRPDPQGLHVLEVRAKCYWPVSRFITIPSSGELRERITLPIRPDHAHPTFPEFHELDDRVRGVLERSAEVKGHADLSGEKLYAALNEEAKAGLLNIAKKSLTMPFKNGGDLLNHITVLEIRGDRCFVSVPQGVREQMAELVDGNHFRPVNGSLHEPPAGFRPAGSFKSLDAFGNLQMTFFEGGSRVVADIDIDDAAGLGHVFQVMRNHVTGSPTHPYNIHQILVHHQHLDPGYSLKPSET
jgi:hypothetical protein